MMPPRKKSLDAQIAELELRVKEASVGVTDPTGTRIDWKRWHTAQELARELDGLRKQRKEELRKEIAK